MSARVFTEDRADGAQQSRIHAYLTVSKAWHAPAQRTLQRYVRLASSRQAASYAALIRSSELARHRLVRLECVNALPA